MFCSLASLWNKLEDSSLALTCTLDSLAEDPMHQCTTHITERGAEEIVWLETMGHINLEPLSKKLK